MPPVEVVGPSDLRLRTVRGIAWNSGAHVAQQVVQFGVSIVLTRLLLPRDFGLVGMVVVFTGFARVLSELGFGSAIVQRGDLTRPHLDSVFWINVTVGVCLCGLLVLIAPLLATFYESPQITTLTRVIALDFVIVALGVVPRSLLQRNFHFRVLAIADGAAIVVAGLVALYGAYAGWGAMALVAQSITASAMVVAGTWIAARWAPRLSFSWRAARELSSYGVNLTAFNIGNYWARNGDNLFIGKVLGSGSLGAYTRAYSLMLLPITQVNQSISRVMFPALASIQDDRVRVKRVYLRTMRVIALITFPMMAGLCVVAEPFVLALFGEQWVQTIPLIRILSVVGILQTMTNPVGWLYTSQGRTDLLFRWGLGGAGALIVAIAIGCALGSITTVAWAYLIGNLVVFYPCIAIPGRLIGMTVLDLLRDVAGVFIRAVAMALLVALVETILPTGWTVALKLLVLIGVGGATYLLLVIAGRGAAAYRDLRTLVQERT